MNTKFAAIICGLGLVLSACSEPANQIDWSEVREHASRDVTSELMVGIWTAQEAPYEIRLDENRRYEVCQVARGSADLCNTGFVEYRAGLGVILLGFEDTDVGHHLLDITGSFGSERTQSDLSGQDIPEGAFDFSPNVTGATNAVCAYNPCSTIGNEQGATMLFRLEITSDFNENLATGNWLTE